MNSSNSQVVIIGGGPAGLTAAYQLSKAKVPSVVFEKAEKVGGLSKTVEYKGFLFDLGGHRFYTKVEAVEKIWHEVLPNGDFLLRPRLSRIYFKKKFFPYPLKISRELLHIGCHNMLMIPASFLKSRIVPYKREDNFEQWVSNRFGKKLFEIFFKTYTEKVWGMKCTEISADWAAQRIKGLSLSSLAKNTLRRKNSNGGVIKTLIEKFHYPQKGPGMMWERMAELINNQDGKVELNSNVDKIFWSERKGVTAVEVESGGERRQVDGSDFISSMPIRTLIRKLEPKPPVNILKAAEKLKYRDFLIVALIINKRDLFPDNWIYIHDPSVKLGRIQNFKNWSPAMVADESKTCLGLEYFCFAGDKLWETADEDLIELGKRELAQIGLVEKSDIVDGKVVRVPKAYPVYDGEYKEALAEIRGFLKPLKNLQFVGRNGMHKYNNQDHSMLTAMLAVENIFGAKHDLWKLNTDEDYLEEMNESSDKIKQISFQLESTQPLIPGIIPEKD